MSAFFHDSACCLVQDGVLVAAAQEERFSRRKHDRALPIEAFRWCLARGGITLADVDCLAYYERPDRKLERQLWQRWHRLTPELCLDLWRGSRRPEEAIRDVLGFDGEIDTCEHHLSHAASAFFLSGHDEAAILTVDGVGEWATTTYAHGRGGDISVLEEVRFPQSIGLFYSTVTSYLGFSVNDGEYKVMGLAPYGQPRYRDEMRQVIASGEGGGFALDPAYFAFDRDDRMYSDALPDLLGGPPRRASDPILPFHQDVARSAQAVLEDLLLDKVRYLHDRVPVDHLCAAGGVALNCVANARILREGPFETLFVPPAAGDAGGAIGAAVLAAARRAEGGTSRRLTHAYLGPAYSTDDVRAALDDFGITADRAGDERALLGAAIDLLASGKVIGWFQGALEFGPRALGARSILADPRDASMRDRINRLIKEREGFRPFAPSVPDRWAAEYFELDHPSPFMLETCRVKPGAALPAVTHVDGSARVQTVDAASHPRYAALLEGFRARTGCGVLLNTSFNLNDEPIVMSPADALTTFARSRLDALVIEDFIVPRERLTRELVAAARQHRPPAPLTRERVYTF